MNSRKITFTKYRFKLENMFILRYFLLCGLILQVRTVEHHTYSKNKNGDLISKFESLTVFKARSKIYFFAKCAEMKNCFAAIFKAILKECSLHGNFFAEVTTTQVEEIEATTVSIRTCTE